MQDGFTVVVLPEVTNCEMRSSLGQFDKSVEERACEISHLEPSGTRFRGCVGANVISI